MPLAKIHVHAGAFSEKELAAIGLAVQASLEQVAGVPPEDYYRITHVLPKGQFVHTPAFVGCTYSNRLIMLELTFVARSRKTKLALHAALNERIVESVGINRDDLLIVLYEVPGENISFGKGLAQRADLVTT